ncbi:MAG: type VI secretion system baseplate subunit TssE [Gemmataceae bacterium]
MAQQEPQQGAMPSMLDRLLEPMSEEDETPEQIFDMELIVNAIRRDLEELLNTHPSYTSIPEEWKELRNSILTYGMPDLASVEVDSLYDKERLAGIVEGIIAQFEPRLKNIKAVILDSQGEYDTSLRFHIDAQVDLDPAPEVAFETVLELMTGQTSVEAKLQ